MTDSTEPHWHRWQVRIWVLLAMPIVCALMFTAISELSRISPEDRWDLEDEWVQSPLKTEFSPTEGARVRSGDPLLKVAWIKKGSAHSWLLTPQGTIGDTWHYGFDTGGNREINSATVDGLARLPEYLKHLPPSDIPAITANSLLVAFPSDGVWVIRRYRMDAVPQEANDMATALDFRSSFNGEAIKAW